MGKFANIWAAGYHRGSLAWFRRLSVGCGTGLLLSPTWLPQLRRFSGTAHSCEVFSVSLYPLPAFAIRLATDSSPRKLLPLSLFLSDLVALKLGEKKRETPSDSQRKAAWGLRWFT